MGVGVFISASFFNHSCRPNCSFALDSNGFLEMRAMRPVSSGELLTMGADANTAIPLPAAVAHPIAPIGVGWEPSNPHAAAVASMPAAVAVAAIPAAVLQLTPGVQYTGFPLHGHIV